MLFVFIYVYLCPTQLQYHMMFVSFKSNTMGVTCWTGTANPSGAPEFTICFSGILFARFLVLCVMFCISLFVPSPLDIVMSVLNRFTTSDYHFGIFKLFFSDDRHRQQYDHNHSGIVRYNQIYEFDINLKPQKIIFSSRSLNYYFKNI